MVRTFFRKLSLIISDKALRSRVLFVLGVILLFRALAAIPVPGIDAIRLEQFLNQNQFLGVLNIFSGGGLSNLSIVMLGVGPYITASIIMQLSTIISPKIKTMYQEEGEAGKLKFMQWSRIITIPLAALQAIAFTLLLESQNILPPLDTLLFVTTVAVAAGGSLLLMWLGELATEFGVGNGVSLLIFAGIVATLPGTLGGLLFTFDVSMIPAYLGFVLLGLFITFGVVVVSEAERPVPIAHARQVHGRMLRGGDTYLPIRLNQAGVIPIIFALSLLLLPNMLAGFLNASGNASLISMGNAVVSFIADPLIYGVLYFALVVLFTYFYTAVTFDPHQVATNLQKSGAFIPGVRPGRETESFLGRIVTRTTFPGAMFLGIIAVLPLIVQSATGIASVAIGGTTLLIAVSVVLDLVRKIDARASLQEY
jgi:preprotein translocase subunit SecY